ncbi:MAG: hypothetical protein FJX35_10330 [Alphaproteobacteria bacterium]|nr:hypothetical protein [Alphaproteobacteria bacterium]
MRATRLLAGFLCFVIVFAPSMPAGACSDFAKAPHSRWTIEREAGAAWLVTPCGDKFFSIGSNVLDGGDRKDGAGARNSYTWSSFYPSLEAWARATRERLIAWGFNSAGAWSLTPERIDLPSTPNLELGRNARFHWFDPFDPATEAEMLRQAERLTKPYRGDPRRIGYFSDNEVGWWNGALFNYFMRAPAANHTKRRLIALLREHYGDDWTRFAADFVAPANAASFDDLLRSEGALAQLRPGGTGIQAVRRWTGVVTEHYYRLVRQALKSVDPEALVFADRLPIYYDPVAVRAMARHVDAIATNYNVDSPDGWLAPYFFDGLRQLAPDKAVLITEWFFAAHENRSGNVNNGHLMTVNSQVERAAGAAQATRNFAAQPDIVGLHWFQWHDHPKGGRSDGEDYNFGLVDSWDVPYAGLVEALKQANREVVDIHRKAASRRGRLPVATTAMPRADIVVGDRSLADWPKPHALVRGVESNAGEIPFGEFYLSWSDAGLGVALIAMDYYDPQILAVDDEFPLGEAFRLELGVDTGTGPQRFALHIVPPKVFPKKGAPAFTARLCRIETGGDCATVDGAATSYFGSDQPRITAEMNLPWPALGLERAPTQAVKLAIGAVAFHRSRWMSWGGRPLDELMADSTGWRRLALGPAVQPSADQVEPRFDR